MTNEEKRNIYNNIQNVYNMDFNTWEEVLSFFYNTLQDISARMDKLENDLKPIILVSPNSTVYKLTVTDTGELQLNKM